MELAHCTINAAHDLKLPRNKAQLKRFLGLCHIYRRFVQNFGRVATLLKTYKPRTFDNLMQEEHDRLVTLHDKLVSAPVLSLTRSRGHLSLDTNACNMQNGCVSMQEQPEQTRPLPQYWWTVHNIAEKSYYTTHRQFLTKFWAVQFQRTDLQRHKLTNCTDQEALKCTLNLTVNWRVSDSICRTSNFLLFIELESSTQLLTRYRNSGQVEQIPLNLMLTQQR